MRDDVSLLTSVQLAAILALVEGLVLWAMLDEPQILRGFLIMTMATLALTNLVEIGPRGGDWIGVRGSYFLMVLLVITFAAVAWQTAVRPYYDNTYPWDVMSLAVHVTFARAAFSYAQGGR